MRAWVFYGSKDVRLEELPEPKPGPGEVAVTIAYNGICGSDLHEYFYGPLFIPLDVEHSTTGHQGPLTLGHEAAGTVLSVGDGVRGVAVGQRVAIEPIVRQPGDDANYNLNAAFYGLMTHGFLADTAVVQAAAVHPLPDSVDLLSGALTEPLSVAWHAASKTGLSQGDTGVVFGGGPIGIGSALSLRARGVEKVAVVEPSANRRKALDSLGFPTFDPIEHGFADSLRQFVGAAGADAVVDAAGVAAAVNTGIEFLGAHGRLVVVAAHMAPVPIDTNQLLIAERSIHASMAYKDDFPVVIEQQAAGAFPHDGWVETIAFGDLADGLSRLAEGKAIKLLVEVGGS